MAEKIGRTEKEWLGYIKSQKDNLGVMCDRILSQIARGEEPEDLEELEELEEGVSAEVAEAYAALREFHGECWNTVFEAAGC